MEKGYGVDVCEESMRWRVCEGAVLRGYEEGYSPDGY